MLPLLWDHSLTQETKIKIKSCTSRMELPACKKYVECVMNTCQNPILYRQIFPNGHRSNYQSTSNLLPIFSNNILEFPTPSTSSPCKKRYSICLEYNIKKREEVGLQQPFFSSDYCCVSLSACSFNRRGKEMMIKADTHTKKKEKNQAPKKPQLLPFLKQ